MMHVLQYDDKIAIHVWSEFSELHDSVSLSDIQNVKARIKFNVWFIATFQSHYYLTFII
jgi:hypothetical protein